MMMELSHAKRREGRGWGWGGAEEDDIHSTLNNPQYNKSCLSEICVYTRPN